MGGGKKEKETGRSSGETRPADLDKGCGGCPGMATGCRLQAVWLNGAT